MSSKISFSLCLGGALTTFPCKLRPKNFFLRPGTPGYAYSSYRQMKCLILIKYLFIYNEIVHE